MRVGRGFESFPARQFPGLQVHAPIVNLTGIVRRHRGTSVRRRTDVRQSAFKLSRIIASFESHCLTEDNSYLFTFEH